MDVIDKLILYDLSANCRMSFQALANRHQMTANAIKKRVSKLEESGVIVKYVVELTPAMIDAEVLLAVVSTDGTQDEDDFANLMGSNPLVFDVDPLTGATYLVFADYTSPRELSELGRFMRGLQGVLSVELHTLLRSWEHTGDEFTGLQLRVLDVLMEDARMPLVSIAEKAGLTTRRVRRTIQELLDSNSVRFTLKWNPEASKGIPFIAHIEFDESEIQPTDCERWLREAFPIPLWEVMISSSNPTIFAYFVAENQTHLEKVARQVRRAAFVKSVITFVNKPTRVYLGPRNHRLTEMLQQKKEQ
ncbi:MAG: AsnC family transcriptional regulator [Candidatus Thorarchaeota archaeon]|nr:MAG: AsnC family transcriptional regulator [Candidatus Thorarchaeota archaeon]